MIAISFATAVRGYFLYLLLLLALFATPLWAVTVTVDETDANQTVAVLSVSLATPCANQNGCSINYTPQGNSAQLNQDFSPAGSQLNWVLGDGSGQNVTVVIIGDDVAESDEEFSIVYSNPIGVELFAPDTVVIIDDDIQAPPIAVDDSATTRAERPVTINVLSNDSDTDGPDPLTIANTSNPSNGSISVSGDSITYTPNTGFVSTDTFTYTAFDGSAESPPATVTVTVINDAPNAVDDSISTPPNRTVIVPVLANDSDPDSGPNPLTISDFGTASNGFITQSSASALSYTPNPNFAGTDTFTYTISDGIDEDTATVTVSTINQPPTPSNDNRTTSAGTPIDIDVLTNDTDPNGNDLTLVSVTDPLLGTAVVNGDVIMYTPPATLAEDAQDSFEYTVSDGFETATATVTVTVTATVIPNNPPDSLIDSPTSNMSIAAGQSINFSGSGTDIDGDTIASFQWEFEGGSPSTSNEQNVTVSYANVGTFTVSLTVTDSRGAVDPTPATLTVTVTDNTTPGSGPQLTSQNPAEQTADFAETVPLSVQIANDSGQPLSDVAVDWSIERLTAGIGDGALAQTRVVSDANGVASNIFSAGTIPEKYRITATLAGSTSSAVQSIIRVGVEDTVSANTPEAAAGRAIDDVCPRLNVAAMQGPLDSADQQDLLDRCNAIVTAGGQNQDGDVATALRQISPAEASMPGRTGELVSAQQIGNLGSRLAALRRSTTSGLSLNGLNFNIDGLALPGSLIESVFTGGAAGDEDGSDPFSRLGVFVTGNISFGGRDRTAEEEGFDFDTLGITAGVDYRFSDNAIAGVALGYANTSADIDDNGGDFDADNLTFSAYGNFYINDEIYIDGVISYGQSDYDLARTINYTVSPDIGPITRTANGDTDGDELGISIGGGYQRAFDNGYSLIVDGRFSYIEANIDKFTEQGASGLNLTIEDQTFDSLTLTLGGEVSKPVSFDWGVLIPRLRFEWEHEFKDDGEDIEFRFASVPGTTYKFETDEADANYFRLGVGANALFTEGRAAFFSIESTLGRKDTRDYSINLGGRFEF